MSLHCYNTIPAIPGRHYQAFLDNKTQEGAEYGFTPKYIPECAFDFQKDMIGWATRKGRAALFEDCGLGKTLQYLAWAQNIVENTNGNVLILTPLAVAAQTAREAEKFGIEVMQSRDGKCIGKITVTNYEQLHLFDARMFEGVVCDESSILKSYSGARCNEIIAFMRKVKYRLLATATAAPNDYIELGTSSEALGYLGHIDMLSRFFRNDQNNVATRRMYGEAPKWRLKGHAELPFWRWVCSWSRAMRKPSDLGFNDDRFILPELKECMHLVTARTKPEGELFELPALTLPAQREEKKRTVKERCEKVAELVSHKKQALVWCQLNSEGDLLEELIPDAVQVAGKHSDKLKEERLLAFADGKIRVLVTKPKIGGMGMNFQNCDHVTYFPSHSFEQYYQAVRRCWRFGQTNDVTVDVIHTEGEARIMENLQRKAVMAEQMFSNLVAEMNNALAVRSGVEDGEKMEVPGWV